jgi:hypothetical protein
VEFVEGPLSPESVTGRQSTLHYKVLDKRGPNG